MGITEEHWFEDEERLTERQLERAIENEKAAYERGFKDAISKAIELLSVQEPVESKWQKGYAYCGQCGYKLHWIVDLYNFCPNCGRAVKWTPKPSAE